MRMGHDSDQSVGWAFYVVFLMHPKRNSQPIRFPTMRHQFSNIWNRNGSVIGILMLCHWLFLNDSRGSYGGLLAELWDQIMVGWLDKRVKCMNCICMQKAHGIVCQDDRSASFIAQSGSVPWQIANLFFMEKQAKVEANVGIQLQDLLLSLYLLRHRQAFFNVISRCVWNKLGDAQCTQYIYLLRHFVWE